VYAQLPFYPEQASNFAPNVDSLMTFLILVSVFFSALITLAIVVFFFKYHRKNKNEVGVPIHGDMRLETAWIVIPFMLAMAMFS
jgi:cytochrome c oxidase subunit II